MKKRIFAILLSLAMGLGLLPAGAFAAGELPFRDLEPNAWYTEAVRYAYESGMMNGTGDGQFSPNATTTRAMVVTLLHRMEKTPEAKGETFSDVAEGAWYAKAVAWASANKIVNGVGDSTFRPDDVITREQFATILYRYARFKGVDVSKVADLSKYPDAGSISEFARTAMAWAVEVGLISGTDTGRLEPLGGATRAQAATILMRYETKVAVPIPSATPTATPTPTRRPSSGGGGGSGSNDDDDDDPTPTPTPKPAITAVSIQKDGAAVTEAVIGDELTVAVEPKAATYDTEWTVTNYTYTNGDDVTMVITAETYAEYSAKETYQVSEDTRVVGTDTSYTVSAADASGKITVEVTGKGDYTGTKTAEAAVEAARAFIAAGETVARVSVAEDAVYKNEAGEEVEVSADSVLKLVIDPQDTSEAVSGMGTGSDNTAKKASVLAVIEKAAGAEAGSLSGEDLPTDATAAEVKVALKLDDQEIHPIGKTVVLLSAGELKVPAGADLNDYVFFAQHTNKDGDTQLDAGKVVTVEGKQYVQFTLNGLSRVWIGNVPPRTVTFDAAGGAPAPAAQKVKFGGYAKYVEPPVRSGYLFAGWDHDIKTQNIITNLTVTALWVKGQTATDDQLAGAWTSAAPAADTYTETKKDGKLTLTFADKEGYTANLSYTLTMTPPAGAVKFAAATTAEGALAAAEYQAVAGNEAGYSITKPVTDAQGVPVDSSTNLYIKWVDADGKPLVLQSMTLAVGNAENYDTQTRKETFEIDRGLGRVSFYLTDGKATPTGGTEEVAVPDYTGNINAYLQERTYNEETGYHLYVDGNFYDQFHIVPETADQQSDYSKGRFGAKDYGTLKIVIDPFEGESFSGTPTVEAYYWDSTAREDVTVSAEATLSEGKILVTCPLSTLPEKVESLDFTVAIGQQAQDIGVSIDRYSSSEDTTVEVETWTQAREQLAAGKSVRYTGTDAVTLTAPLTLNTDQDLYIESASFTVGNGGRLELKGTQGAAASVRLNKGAFTVADGGALVALSQDPDQNSYSGCGISAYNSEDPAAGTITIARGGKVEVEYVGFLSFSTTGQVLVEEGAQVIDEGFMRWNKNTVDGKAAPADKIAGTVTVGSAQENYTFFDCEGTLEVTSTGTLTYSGQQGRLEVNGGLINAGAVSLSGGSEFTFNGATDNSGTITVSADAATVQLYNTGYSVQNSGVITVAGTLDVTGTVLVNTGAINGSGKILTGEFAAVEAAYDEVNGLAYLNEELDNEWQKCTPELYPHYEFTADPAASVEATVLIGELSNQGEGTCTAAVQK